MFSSSYIINLLFIVVGILGYFFGKYISKKVENYNKLVWRENLRKAKIRSENTVGYKNI